MMGIPEEKGIIPRISAEIFQAIADKLEDSLNGDGKLQCMITVSYLEIYNETIKDLLNPSDKQLKIHEHPEDGIYVKDLCELVRYMDREVLVVQLTLLYYLNLYRTFIYYLNLRSSFLTVPYKSQSFSRL